MQIADAHNDLLMTYSSNAEVSRYLNFCKHNEVVKLFTAYYFDFEQKNKLNADIFEIITQKFSLLTGYDFVVKTFENIGFVEDVKSLQKLIKLKPFSATLTWNYDNKLAGGALSNKKLTKWGKRVTNLLNQNNILVDSAHLNKQSFWDVADIQREIFCSHTASESVYPIKRNLDKEQLNEIGKRNGYVGLCLYNSLLGGSFVDFEQIRRHLDNLIEYSNENCVGLGTDFNGTGEQNPEGISMDYLGMQDLYSYLSKFYSNTLLEKVFYKNLINFENRMRINYDIGKFGNVIKTEPKPNKKGQQATVLEIPTSSNMNLAGEQRFEL